MRDRLLATPTNPLTGPKWPQDAWPPETLAADNARYSWSIHPANKLISWYQKNRSTNYKDINYVWDYTFRSSPLSQLIWIVNLQMVSVIFYKSSFPPWKMRSSPELELHLCVWAFCPAVPTHPHPSWGVKMEEGSIPKKICGTLARTKKMHLFVDDYTSKVCHTCQSTIMLCSKTPSYSNPFKRTSVPNTRKISWKQIDLACQIILWCAFK